MLFIMNVFSENNKLNF